MRRITLMAVSTLAAVIMLFSYRTSTQGSTAEAAAIAQPPGIVTAAAPKPAHSATRSTKSAKSAAKPAVKPATKPATKPTTKPATKPTTKPAAKPTTKPTAKPTTPAQPTSLTVNGTTAQTPFGPVQVQVTISANKIISVKALQHPSGNGNSDQINARALPQLAAEVLSAQSARVNTISGATYTSNGYTSSLQAALDTAHFA